jgi:hypothetical protein
VHPPRTPEIWGRGGWLYAAICRQEVPRTRVATAPSKMIEPTCPPLSEGAAHRWPRLIPLGHDDPKGVHEAVGGEQLAEHGDRLALDPTLLPPDLDVALGTDASPDDALDRALRDAEPQEPWKLERDLPKRALITTPGSCASYPASQGLATFRRGCGSGAYAAPRGRMSAKSGCCSWSCSMRPPSHCWGIGSAVQYITRTASSRL